MFVEKMLSTEELEKVKTLEKTQLGSSYVTLENSLLKYNEENREKIKILNGQICRLKVNNNKSSNNI